MEPNQQQPPRGDYTSVPADRQRPYAGQMPQPIMDVRPPARQREFAPEQSSAESTPSQEPSPQPTPQPPVFTDVKPPASYTPPTQPTPPMVSEPSIEPAEKLLEAPAPEPLLEAPDPEPLLTEHAAQPVVNDIAPAIQPATIQPSVPPAPARPFQITAPEPTKPAVWKTQKFWLITSSALFAVLLCLGTFAWYKATHHKPDTKIPVTAVENVDTDHTIRTVGTTAAEQAANKTRQQTIIKLHDAVEAFYTQKLYYPSTTDMTNATWVTTNLKGIKVDDLKDPSGVIATIVAVPVKNQYAYQSGAAKNLEPCDNISQNCNYYTLTATLSDGSTYVKSALR